MSEQSTGEKSTGGLDTRYLDQLFRHHRNLGDRIRLTEKERTRTRAQVEELVQEHGVPDEKGHVWLPGEQFMAKRQKNKKTRFDPAKADRFLEEHGEEGDYEAATEVVPEHRVLTEESFNVWLWKNHHRFDNVSPDDFKTTEVTWSIVVNEEEQYDY